MSPNPWRSCTIIALVKRQREGISIRYAIADPMIFSLCNLVCRKMEWDTKCAAALFDPEI